MDDTQTPDTDAPETEPADIEPAADETAPVDEPLGDGGKRALDAERKARTAAEKQLKTMQAELDALREAQMSEAEKAVAAAKAEGAAEVLASVNRRLFSAEVRAATAGRLEDPDLLADPDVATRLLGLDEIPLTATGDVDSEAISHAIEQLLEAKPYLKASGAKPIAGSADQGTRTTPEQPDPTRLTDPAAVIEWARSNRSRRF